MKTITIKVHKIHRIVSTNYRRTSDGYIYDADDITSYEIWLSSPISFSNEADRIISQLSKHYESKVFIEEYGGWHIDENTYSAELTKGICLLFNYVLSDSTREFVEWNPENHKECHFQLVKSFDYKINAHTFKVVGRHQEDEEKTLGHVKPFSPFESIDELKDGIACLCDTGHNAPQSWISYLIKYSEEDLSDYLSKFNIQIDCNKIKICNDNGELYLSLKNHNCQSVQHFIKWSRFMSYSTACKLNDKPTIEFYQRYGASPLKQKIRYKEIDDDYEGFDADEWAEDCKDEIRSWNDEWEWNID